MFHSNTILQVFGDQLRRPGQELIQNGFYGAIIGTEIMRKTEQIPRRKNFYGFIDELAGIMEQAR